MSVAGGCWVSVRASKQLAEKIQETATKHGYVSVMEFVRDAIRRRLEELRENGFRGSCLRLCVREEKEEVDGK